jgi:hypothetical protein
MSDSNEASEKAMRASAAYLKSCAVWLFNYFTGCPAGDGLNGDTHGDHA